MSARRPTRRLRGALLIELLASLAIFIVGALAILSAMRQSTDSMLLARDRQHAANLARSAMAAIEAGILEPDALSGPVPAWDEGWLLRGTPGGWEEDGGAFLDAPPEGVGWTLEVDAEPSEFAGLEIVTVRAFRGEDPELARGATFALRQLVRLTDRVESLAGGAP